MGINILDKKLDRLIGNHSKRCGITKEEGTRIISGIFKAAKEVIAQADIHDDKTLREIYIPTLGMFVINEKRVYKLKENEAIKAGKQ